MTASAEIKVERLDNGAIVRIVLARPKANILDGPTVDAITEVLAKEGAEASVRAVIFDHEGPNFSFGASVAEHLPGHVHAMLLRFHDLFRALIKVSKPLVAVVRGQCLGGGLELAAFCHRVFADPTAKLGQSEINLAVFAPMASLVLPRRLSRQADADDLLLTGRTVDAKAALAMGLVDQVDADPGAAALDWVRTNFHGKSAAALGCAVAAARHEFNRAVLAEIGRLETLYLDGLMKKTDPVEGLKAFLEKRAPVWTHA